MSNDRKPLGGKAYGSIPHLPGSRRGPADKGLSDQQAALLTVKTRDRHDVVIVQEKLDGSNVGAARIDGQIVALTRAGYEAISSPFPQHHAWHRWAMRNADRFMALLADGERVMGEWLMQAHGTRYAMPHEPFVAFDIMRGIGRLGFEAVRARCESDRVQLTTPRVLHVGGALSIGDALVVLGEHGHHGALDPVEGAVWRMERKGSVDFLGKYVKPGKVDGCYLESVTGNGPVLNWTEPT